MPTARTSCGIKNIVYLLTYPCQSAYIIKTNLELKARFSERNINTDGCSSSFVHWPLSVPLSFKVWQWHFLLWGGDRDRVLFCVCSLQTDSTVCSEQTQYNTGIPISWVSVFQIILVEILDCSLHALTYLLKRVIEFHHVCDLWVF